MSAEGRAALRVRAPGAEARRLFPGLHRVVVILLPLGLVLLVFGWIFGFVSSLVGVPRMLVGSASYLLFCSESGKASLLSQ